MQECGFDPWFGKISHGEEQLSLCITTTEAKLQNWWATATEAHMLQLLKPVCFRAHKSEPMSPVPQPLKPAYSRASKSQLLSPRSATTEACVPWAYALQQEKPPQWEAWAPWWRVAPAHCN